MKTIQDIDINNKIVLVRVDYNVPLKDGKVESNLRIKASLPTINYLLEHKAKKIILISHLGRPEGKTNPDFTLSPVADSLQKLLNNQKVGFYPLPKSNQPINIREFILSSNISKCSQTISFRPERKEALLPQMPHYFILYLFFNW